MEAPAFIEQQTERKLPRKWNGNRTALVFVLSHLIPHMHLR